MRTPLACSDYYGASAPSHGPRSTTDPPATGPAARREGRPGMVPTFTTESIDEGGARLDPDSIATPTPQFFDVASPPDPQTGFGVDPHRTSDTGHALHTGPYPSGLSRLWTYGASDSGSSRTPSHHCLPDPSRLTVPTRPVRCRGCSHHRVRSHVLAAPSFTGQLRLTGGGVLTPPLDSRRFVAHCGVPEVGPSL
jgi:hypothetical protein